MHIASCLPSRFRMLGWKTLNYVELHPSGVRRAGDGAGEGNEAAIPCMAVHHCRSLAAIGFEDRVDVVDMERGERGCLETLLYVELLNLQGRHRISTATSILVI